ncbi:MAG: carbohydrate porin [Bacteroidales bacterium]|jgi:porin|nr:carbohydrate porin [Bacteroidales bacterium]
MNIHRFLILILLPFSISAQKTDTLFYDGFSFNGDLYVDGVYNYSGEIKQGTGYAAMGLAKVTWTSDNAGLWNGTEVLFSISPLVGSYPSDDLVGDFQGISNIDAGGNYICFQEVWIKHNFKHFSISAGLHDANSLFAISEHATLFINGSFGIPSLIAESAVAPLFPLTAPGIDLEIPLGDKLAFNTAVYDGMPTDFEDNPYNLSWSLSQKDGLLSLNELVIQHASGYNKIGFFYHSGTAVYNETTELYDTVFEHNYGLYAISDQEIWKNNDNSKSISTFVQIVMCPQRINEHSAYVGGGFVFTGFDSKQNSIFGLALAHAQCDTHSLSETVIELSYAYQITEQISIQPDIQYVLNESVSYPLVGLMRCGIEF